MKKTVLILFCGLALVACTGAKLKAGNNVIAKWGNDWYLAKVKAVSGTKYDVHYDDGTDGTVESGEIKALPADPKLNVGDKVWASWGGAKLYSGTVKEVQAEGYLVEWDDGSDPSTVAKGKLAKQ